MKKFRNSTLIVALLVAGSLSACTKGDKATPGTENGQLKNSAQLFFGDNTSVVLEGNDVVTATLSDNTLKATFSQNGTDVTLEIPNYDLNSNKDYPNGASSLNIKRANKTYNSAFIFIPVIVGNPPRPVFVTDQTVIIKSTNLKVDGHTIDIALQIPSGSALITVPASNGSGPVYEKLDFVQGTGGKPNMINIRIKR